MSERLSCFWTNIDIIKMQMQFGGEGDRERFLSWYAHRYRHTEGETRTHKHTQTLTENTEAEILHMGIAKDDEGLEQIPLLSKKLLRTMSVGFLCRSSQCTVVYVSMCVYVHTHTQGSMGFRLPSPWPLLRAVVWWEKKPAFTPGPGRSLGSG